MAESAQKGQAGGAGLALGSCCALRHKYTVTGASTMIKRLLLGIFLFASIEASAEPPKTAGWPLTGGDPGGMCYSLPTHFRTCPVR